MDLDLWPGSLHKTLNEVNNTSFAFPQCGGAASRQHLAVCVSAHVPRNSGARLYGSSSA